MNSKEKVQITKGIDKVRRMQYEDALSIFERLLDANPNIVEAWNNKGVAYYKLDRLEESLGCYERALSIDPENMEAQRNRGFVLRALGRLEESLQVYDTILQKGNSQPLDLEATAFVLAGLGKLEEALECVLLARESLPLDRFEKEIGQLKSMISERDNATIVSEPEKEEAIEKTDKPGGE